MKPTPSSAVAARTLLIPVRRASAACPGQDLGRSPGKGTDLWLAAPGKGLGNRHKKQRKAAEPQRRKRRARAFAIGNWGLVISAPIVRVRAYSRKSELLFACMHNDIF